MMTKMNLKDCENNADLRFHVNTASKSQVSKQKSSRYFSLTKLQWKVDIFSPVTKLQWKVDISACH